MSLDESDASEPQTTVEERDTCRLKAAQTSVYNSVSSRLPKPLQPALSQPTTLDTAPAAVTPDAVESGWQQQHEKSTEPIYYLAYGSNLSAETFQGVRGIKPISQMNVCVPSLRMTFDLPGLPYREPCFANTARRIPDRKRIDNEHHTSTNSTTTSPSSYAQANGITKTPSPSRDEKSPLLSDSRVRHDPDPTHPRYHKNAWRKPLVGVLYELTPKDFAHVIATEGGGASYQDIKVPCYPLSSSPSEPVPWEPTVEPIIGHTLFAPSADGDDSDPSPDPNLSTHDAIPQLPTARRLKANRSVVKLEGGRFHRPDPNYAQPSQRYLDLIMTGAAEHDLPTEYRDYLAQLRPYRATTIRQQIGAVVFLATWGPLFLLLLLMIRMFTNKKGRSPAWLAQFASALFGAVWTTYDSIFVVLFGDGERTLGE